MNFAQRIMIGTTALGFIIAKIISLVLSYNGDGPLGSPLFVVIWFLCSIQLDAVVIITILLRRKEP